MGAGVAETAELRCGGGVDDLSALGVACERRRVERGMSEQ